MLLKIKKITLLGITSFFLITQAAFAAGGSGMNQGDFTIHPTYPNTQESYSLMYELKPGDNVTDYFTVKNFSTDPVHFSFYSVDKTYTKDFQLTYKTEDQPKLFAANWITLEHQQLTLQPSEEQTLSVTIQIPKDAPLNSFIAGIAMEKTASSPGSSGITVKIREILPVKIKVTPTPKLIPHFVGGINEIFSILLRTMQHIY